MDFQSGQPVLMGFLSEMITTDDQSPMSPFMECIILATISGRALCHRHQSSVENLYVNVSQDFWSRHQWINAILMQRMRILALKYPPASYHADPMLLFTNMMAQTTVLYLYKTMECVTPVTDENRAAIVDYERCSLLAAQEIVNLTKELTQLSCFKVRVLGLLRRMGSCLRTE